MLSPPRSRKHGPEPAYSCSYDSGSHNSGSKVKETSIVRVIQLALLKWKLLGIQRKVLTFLVVIIIVFVSANIAQIPSSESYSRLSHPRLIQMKTDFTVKTSIDVEEFAAKTYSEKVPQPWLTGAEIEHGRENFEEKDCKAMHEWQVKSFPNCNNIHESDFLSYSYVTSGGWRDVWRVNEFNNESYVVKTLRWKGHEFRFRDAERHRRDANAYSMVKGSKHIMNIYGHCVNTASFDFVTEGSLNDMLMDKEQMSKLKSKRKLRYAWHIAKSLSDLHSFGNIHGSAAMAHTDIASDQFLWFDGMFKLNDFNRGRFIRWNEVKQEVCPFYIGSSPGRLRSPEEYNSEPLTEKIDVYSLGNILWQLVIGSPYIFTQYKHTEDVLDAVKEGRVQVDKELVDSFDENELAVLTAKEMCHRLDPAKRSTAVEVERFLRRKLKEFNINRY